jgi:hypothetical protein
MADDLKIILAEVAAAADPIGVKLSTASIKVRKISASALVNRSSEMF